MAKPHLIKVRATDHDMRILDELREKRVKLAKLRGEEPPANTISDAVRTAIRESYHRVSSELIVAQRGNDPLRV